MKKNVVTVMMAAMMAATLLVGCGAKEAAAPAEAPAAEEVKEEAKEEVAEEVTEEPAEETAEEAPAETVVLKCIGDLTPHSEILGAAKEELAKAGIELDIVSTSWDPTWNEMLVDGEVDFAYFMHVPAMHSIEDEMGTTLYSMGGIHVEPYACFSSKYASKDELPENAIIAIPNDSSNEYRALKVLESEGFVKLNPEMTAVSASVNEIDEYVKPIEIIEMDQANIIPAADDFDAYFVNVNRALEAGIDTQAYLMREGEDSEYANIITVTEANKDNEAIKKMVEILQSDVVKDFINSQYNGAVIPAKN